MNNWLHLWYKYQVIQTLRFVFTSMDSLSFPSPLAECVSCILSAVWNYWCIEKYPFNPQSCAVSAAIHPLPCIYPPLRSQTWAYDTSYFKYSITQCVFFPDIMIHKCFLVTCFPLVVMLLWMPAWYVEDIQCTKAHVDNSLHLYHNILNRHILYNKKV